MKRDYLDPLGVLVFIGAWNSPPRYCATFRTLVSLETKRYDRFRFPEFPTFAEAQNHLDRRAEQYGWREAPAEKPRKTRTTRKAKRAKR